MTDSTIEKTEEEKNTVKEDKYTPPTEVNLTASNTPQPETIQVDADTAFKLKMSELDQQIAEAESVVGQKKFEKASLIHQTNVGIVRQRDKEQKINAKVQAELQQ